MNDSGNLGDLLANNLWLLAVPAVALAWGLLTARDVGRERLRGAGARRRARRVKIDRARRELKAARATPWLFA